MSLKKTTRRGYGTLTELNITPLLDLVFVLLVIFIITTPQTMNNLEMALPSGKPPPRKRDEPIPKITRIHVDAAGQAFVDDESFALPGLRDKLRQLKAARADLRVVVKADDDTDYQSLVSVLDVLQQLEITKVGLATQAAASP
jgi:biopolymer transport protein ExbD